MDIIIAIIVSMPVGVALGWLFARYLDWLAG